MSLAVDTSTLIAHIMGDSGEDTLKLTALLPTFKIVLPPPVLTEAFSNSRTRDHMANLLEGVALLEITDGYWLRASALRAKVLAHGWKARLADTLIAQVCIDHNVPLLTRDADYRHYATVGGLTLA